MQQRPRFIDTLVLSPDFVTGVAGGDQALCDRLTGSLDMQQVWDEVEALFEGDCGDLWEFIDMCARLRKQWAATSKLTKKQRTNIVAKAAKQAVALADLLENQADEIRAHLGPGRNLGEHIKDAASGLGAESATTIATAIDGLQRAAWESGAPTMPSVAEVLRALAKELSTSHNWDHEIAIPTKVNDPNAERTYCVRALTKYFRESTGEPHFELVARTVTAVLDLAEPMVANWAAKLSADV